MPLPIAGIVKTSVIDYPKNICSTIFLAGCNFRCPYCHNPDLVDIKPEFKSIAEAEILEHLEKRKNVLDGICITGGEPLLFDLTEFLEKVKALGLLVKVDTNGTNPERLKELIDKKLVDYIAMDIKAPLEKYSDVVKAEVNTEDIQKSVSIIMESRVDYEFRTTLLPSLITEADIIQIGEWLKGAKKYALQQFTPIKCLDPEFLNETPYSVEALINFKDILKKYFDFVEVRN